MKKITSGDSGSDRVRYLISWKLRYERKWFRGRNKEGI